LNVLGIHLLLELKDCNPKLLDDLDYIRAAMLQAAHDTGVHVVGESFHRFSPQGVTGILSIAESHISIHTWPEYGYAAADVFTCGSALKPAKAAQMLAELLESKSPDVMEVRRGMLPLVAAH
jgi:S-adenosylmethionine decarboxylase